MRFPRLVPWRFRISTVYTQSLCTFGRGCAGDWVGRGRGPSPDSGVGAGNPGCRVVWKVTGASPAVGDCQENLTILGGHLKKSLFFNLFFSVTYTFRCTTQLFNICIYCDMTTSASPVPVHHHTVTHVIFLVMRTFKICTLSNFQMCHTVLLTIVPILYITSL